MQNQEKIIQAIATCIEQYSDTLLNPMRYLERKDQLVSDLYAAIAPHLEAGAGLSEARNVIVKVAASLVRQQASEYAEDLDLPKTTPITAIRKFETEAQNWNDRNRLRAIELKRAYDLLK